MAVTACHCTFSIASILLQPCNDALHLRINDDVQIEDVLRQRGILLRCAVRRAACMKLSIHALRFFASAAFFVSARVGSGRSVAWPSKHSQHVHMHVSVAGAPG